MSAELLQLACRATFPGFDLDVDERWTMDGVTCLFGPSGSGKTTLLRVLAGFETPAGGRIQFGDQVWFDHDHGANTPPWKRPVGLLFQDARLFAHLSVAGNLKYAARRHRSTTRPIAADDVIDALDLSKLMDRSVTGLSGGEKQRVALARTLLTCPNLLLLDEPLTALDQEHKVELLSYLEEIPRRFGIATIVVSHSIDEVVRLASQVVVVAGGRVHAAGPTAEIVERIDLQAITGRFEAGSVVEARVTGFDKRLVLTRLDLNGASLVMPAVERLEPGQHVRLRIRARDVAVATRRPEGLSIRNVLSATVAEIVPESDTAFAEVFLQLSGGRIRARLTRSAVEDLELDVGMSVFALIKSVSFDRRLL
ncbi:MAG: molybdenum ABC transporter ATP-binding protein [Acidobacteriota bacterium]|nr:molybdenum ABC transporter ATP-binding protein [Acidobacteriota bacterium]MDH3785896.1 molybdenum ABC transporter ATP-binding protein [Acidobacteriota bacterium]